MPSALHCDAAALGLGPSEAAMVDPQQRLLLELAHEVSAMKGSGTVRVRKAGGLGPSADGAHGDGQREGVRQYGRAR